MGYTCAKITQNIRILMLKYLTIALLMTCGWCAGDLIDPEFYLTNQIEQDGHLWNIILIIHADNCPCTD